MCASSYGSLEKQSQVDLAYRRPPTEKGREPTLTTRVALRGLQQLFSPLDKNLRLLYLSNLVGAFGDGLYAYLLPTYIRDSLGAGSVDIGLLYAVMFLCSATTPMPGAVLADRFERKKVMILSWILWLPVPYLLSAATHWTQLFPTMILYGVFISGPSTTAYIASTARRDKATLTFTLLSSSWSIGYIFSPTIGGHIAASAGMKAVFRLVLVFYLMAAALLFFIDEQRGTKGPDVENMGGRASSERRKVAAWTAFFALVFFVDVLMRPFIPTFLEDAYNFNEVQIGAFGSITFAGSALLGVLIGRVGDRYGNKVAIALSLAFGAVSLMLLQLSSSLLILVPTSFMMGATYAPWPLMNATISSIAPENVRWRWVALSQSLSMSAAFIAPYIGGNLYAVSPNLPFTVAVAGSTILAAAALVRR
jgi:MFS family permease